MDDGRPFEGVVLTIREECDRLWCAAEVRGIAKRVGLGDRAAWEVAISTAELVSNAVKFGRGGELRVRSRARPRPMIEVEVRDRGPGIEDVERAIEDGYSSPASGPERRKSLGAGLGAVRRLMSSLRIERGPAGGAVVTAAKWEP